MTVAEALGAQLPSSTAVYDWVDPSTGLMMRGTNYNAVYSEQLGIDHFLKGYKSVQVGMCRMTDHPVYGLQCYPASIFTSVEDHEMLR